MPDKILDEIWAIKDELAEECGHDLRRLFAKLKAAQKQTGGRVVNRMKSRFPATPSR